MSTKPNPHEGLRHLALYSNNLEACTRFYSEILGMKIVWQPDADNIYLSSGTDNLALHRAAKDFHADKNQRLDHLGFFLKLKEDVDAWHEYLLAEGVEIKAAPKDHRDGTRSLYCADPDGNVVQIIYYPL
jgi:catechol 2,3-dioxygenase-like lactoylglutathione lyase family enzyme